MPVHRQRPSRASETADDRGSARRFAQCNVAFFEGFRTPAEHSTNKRHALLAGVRKPPEKETAGEGTKGRAVFGVSAGTEGRFFIQPEGYGMKIAK